ncbi:MAG: xylose isomerase [Deltaproteobacteria bacterium]|nr:xylose isomerase [Deltaproteobacteria bacterium]MBN2671105.1 xylose isomerase [Deltaproteobacteria bacterium]
MTYYTGKTEHFAGIGKIPFEGRKSDTPLAYKFYDANKVVAGKTMAEHLRFAVAYWHSFCGTGADPFGAGTRNFSWEKHSDPVDNAMEKLDAAFEFITKLGVPYYCFHDRDMAPAGDTVAQSEANLQKLVAAAKERQNSTGVKLLWGTANLFSHPKFMNGASTNPQFEVVAAAAAQVKAALDATVALGGENYVFWGGREGYTCLLNTDMKQEIEHMGRFLQMARDYGRSIGFKGAYLVEPKPMEPSKHQYDVDAATVIGFLKEFGLENDFKLNIEANHATLASHSFTHELQISADAGMLGSIDANRGDAQNGWDTDQFPTDIYQTTEAMMVVLQNGGLGSGGLNFDAKLRRNSTDAEDLFLAHIGGMDAFARGLEIADQLLANSALPSLKSDRYASFQSGNGLKFANGEMDLTALAALAPVNEEMPLVSGKQELIENIINQYLYK